MRTIHISGFTKENGKIPFGVSLQKTISEGFGWQAELDAQEQVATQLTGVLGPEFVLLRGLILPGLDTPIPLVLVGPPGVFILFVSPLKGTFRARGDVWLVLDATGNMRPSKPNLPTRARLFAEAVRKYLLKNNITVGDVDAVLLFVRTDAFVENIKAPIRIVLADGVESYASSLCLATPVIPPDQIPLIVRMLAGSKDRAVSADTAKGEPEISAQAVVMPSSASEMDAIPFRQEDSLKDYFSTQHAESVIPQPPEIKPAMEDLEPLPATGLNAFLRQAHINRKQALLLAIFGAVDSCAIIVLLSLAIYLLRSQ
jgi:hypothetical protein